MNLQLPDAVQRLALAFHGAGHALFLVGGTVRDALLDRPVEDIDLATDATPPQIKQLARTVGPTAVYAVGERFGTIGLILEGHKVEVTTFRAEVYRPRSRKPLVEFGASLTGDLARRDFTINAIAFDPISGALQDPFDGRQDLAQRVVRAVGNAEERFAEDPLRLLRAARFSAQLDFSIAPETAVAMARTADQLQHISKERVLEEFHRILLSPVPSVGLRVLVDFGLMTYVVPELLEMRGMDQEGWHHKDVYEHVLTVIDNAARLRDGLERPKALALMWGALMHDIAKPRTRGLIYTCRNCGHQWFSGRDAKPRPPGDVSPCGQCGGTNVERSVHFRWHEQIGEQLARDIMTRLRCDRELIDSVTKLVALHGRVNAYQGEWTDGAVRRFIREIDDDLDIMFRLSRADITSRRPSKVKAAIERIAELEARTAQLLATENTKALRSPLDGNDLMRRYDRRPGPWIGQVKDHLLALVIDGKLGEDDVARAEQLADEFVATQLAQ